MTDAAVPPTAEGGEDFAQPQQPARTLIPPTPAHFTLAAALVALGDLTLFDVTPGAAAGLSFAALVVATAALNPKLIATRAGWIVMLLLFGICAALAEAPTLLAVGLGVTGLAAFAVSKSTRTVADAVAWLERSLAFLLHGPLRLPIDLIEMPRWAGRYRWYKSLLTAGWVWFVPLLLSLVFLALFSSANPIIAGWLDALRLFQQLDFSMPSAGRVALWVALAIAVWPFLRGALDPDETSGATEARARSRSDCEFAHSMARGIRASVLPPAVVCRSLLLFNVVFALQNGIDLRYLWARETLPEGVTYAAYAHDGTYPLAASALLAALFVLLAFPSRSRKTGARLPAALMYLWMAQTVFLVASAMQRMGLYIDAYALTYLRVAGLVVMGLIASGLVLIACRIALARSNLWLINANAAVLIGTLCAATFVDIDRIIADYNVANCRETGGNGVPLDVPYLESLGPSALPALRRFATSPATIGSPKSWFVRKVRGRLSDLLIRRQSDWRSWTYRGHRLMQGSWAP